MHEFPWKKILTTTKVKPEGINQYFNELTTLGNEVFDILDRGKKWSGEIASVLSHGGGVIFPHTYFSKCGEHTGAVIHAILDSGANQVIMLGTAHPFPGLFEARVKEFNGEDISQEPSWGVLDPETAEGKALLKNEYSLSLFKSAWDMEIKRRGIKAPRLIERYPNLVNGHPEKLPGMQDLKQLARNAVIIGTEDYCHHGIAYALPNQSAMNMDEKALAFARQQIEEGYSLLQQNKYSEFYRHGMQLNALGDPTDVSATIHYLVGSHAKPKILDLKLVDVSPLFENDPSPSWVAATLATIS